ncbi:MAG: S8 family serine peptidase [Pyrinomonadaceae bacterium]|nr:S8 family serine peptidase [Phycisphaerales bacterium]
MPSVCAGSASAAPGSVGTELRQDVVSANPSAAARHSDSGVSRGPAFVARPGVMEFSGRMIVRPVQQGARQAEPARDAAARLRFAGNTVRYYPEVDEYVVTVPAGMDENTYSAELMKTGDYQYAHPDWICYPDSTPNDPQFSGQWHHPRIQSPQAWDIGTGNAAIICAFVDTGIDLTHPDLAPNRVPGYNSASHLAEINGGDVSDINGHGTHVAGDGAAIGNNAVGVSGTGWNFRIMMVRTSNVTSGNAFISDILEGARWAADNDAKVVSASYGGVEASSVGTTGTYIKGVGSLFLYAAGNSSTNHASFDYPDVIVVGASDEGDNRAGFSSYGVAVDVFAPGTNILSTTNGGGYGYASGTSMATPVTNGALALIWSVNPSFTAQQVEDFLEQGADDIGNEGNDNVFGWGRINVFRSVQLAMATMGPAHPYAIADTASVLSGTTANVDVLANDFDVNGDAFSITSFTASSVQGGTVVRVVGGGPGGRDVLRYSPPSAGFAGSDSFSYTIIDGGGLLDTAAVSVTVLDPALFRAPENPAHTAPRAGVSYYAIPNLSELPNFGSYTAYASEFVNSVNFPSTDGNFAGSGRADDIAAVFEGYINIPSPGTYTLYTSSDDGSKLYIGSQTVVNNDGLHGMQEASGTIDLQAGRHACRVEFFERGGGAGVIASIAGPGLAKQVIPASMWSHGVPCPCDWNQSGAMNSQDFFDFIASFFASNADFNRDGSTTSQDFFDFLACFFAGS